MVQLSSQMMLMRVGTTILVLHMRRNGPMRTPLEGGDVRPEPCTHAPGRD